MTAPAPLYIAALFTSGFSGGQQPVTVDLETARAQLFQALGNDPEFVGIAYSSQPLTEADARVAAGGKVGR